MALQLDDITSALLQNEGKGWKIDLFIDSNVRKEYGCCVCNNICKNAVELSCDVDHDDDNIQIYCQQCLESMISSNNGQCPIDNHSKPTYSPNRRIRGKINKAKVLCPNSVCYEQQKAKLDKDNDNGNVFVDTADEKEGMNVNNDLNRVESKGCKFDGCLSELIGHISKCCESNLDSKEVQSEMIKVLRKDIVDIKNENNVIKNEINAIKNENKATKNENNAIKKNYTNLQQTVSIQTAKIDELTKQNINITQKYEQQNEKIKQLENMINLNNAQQKQQNEKVKEFENTINSIITEQKEQKQEEAINTTILAQKESNQLLKFLPFDNPRLTLLYRASRDGYDWTKYYDMIGNKLPTVCIVHSENNYVFGGYTKTVFNRHVKGGVDDTKDLTAFIFSIRRKGSFSPQKWTINSNANFSYRMSTSYGPIFGSPHAWYLYGNMRTGHSIVRGDSDTFAIKDDKLLAGASTYKVEDVEVFHVE